MTEVKQLKLISGEEVICELVAIEVDDYDAEVMVIRAAYNIISQEDFENKFRYYTFRPFMAQIIDPSHILVLNSGSVLCMTNPATNVYDQYIEYIEHFRKEERSKEHEQEKDLFDEIMEESEKDEKIVKFNPKLH